MFPQISAFTVIFDKPYEVRLSLAGFCLFYSRTNIDPFDARTADKMTAHLVDLLWCMAVKDHPELTYETACATFTGEGLFRLADQLLKSFAPAKPQTGRN
jgi:hypothetical protein